MEQVLSTKTRYYFRGLLENGTYLWYGGGNYAPPFNEKFFRDSESYATKSRAKLQLEAFEAAYGNGNPFVKVEVIPVTITATTGA